MAKIEVKFDPTIEHSEIIARLDNTSVGEVGDSYDYNKNQTGLQQTSIYGIQCPILAINELMIAYEDILSFTLNDTGKTPSVNATIRDRKGILQKLITPGADNEMRVQILPPFDDAYKKINLTLFISSFNVVSENIISVSGTYKLPTFTNSQFKAFGEVSMYQLLSDIASESGLGFATNVEDGEDKRFVYCAYKSYSTILDKEVTHSGSENIIYDWWISPWDYLTLANMYDRYYSIDPEEEMNIWISNQTMEVGENIKIEPIQVKAELTNLFGFNNSQLYVKNYRIMNNHGSNVQLGTDKVFSIYSMNDDEYKDNLLQNGEVKKDIYTNFSYLGEVYGDYDYITSGMYREPFYQIMNSETLEIDLDQPLLGLMRGNQVIFSCYYNNDMENYTQIELKDAGIENENPETDVPIDEVSEKDYNAFHLDPSVSGQYLITGIRYTFNNRRWTQTCILTRPPERKPKILNTEEEETTAGAPSPTIPKFN